MDQYFHLALDKLGLLLAYIRLPYRNDNGVHSDQMLIDNSHVCFEGRFYLVSVKSVNRSPVRKIISIK